MTDDRSRSDEVLLRLAAGGDADALGAFYRRYVGTVVAFFRRRTGDAQLAADLTAETFAGLLTALPRYREERAPARSWLFAIAHNKLRESWRNGRVETEARQRLAMQRVEVTDEDLDRIDEIGIDEPTLRLLNDLPEDQREAVMGRIVDERDYRDLAQRLECSEAVVRQRVSRGLSALRSRIGG